MSIKSAFKLILNLSLRAAFTLKIDLLLNKNKLLVLMYHGVTDKKVLRGSVENYDGKHVFAKKFENQLKKLSKRYTPISLAQLNSWILNKKKLPKNPILFTFDDGYENNYSIVYPLLKKYNVPAIIFVCPDLVGTINWPDKVEWIIANAQSKKIFIFLNKKLLHFNLNSDSEKINAIIRLKKEFADIATQKREEKINELVKTTRAKLNFSGNYKLMNWNKIKELSENGIAICSHSMTHPALTKEPPQKVKEELEKSKKIIENKTKILCTALAYPSGIYDETVKKITKETEYLCAFTVDFGKNTKQTDKFAIKRIPVTNNQSNTILFINLIFNFNKLLFKMRKWLA